jgi:hypothetical protein
MIQWISIMIPLVCLAHQGWILMQQEWSKWSGKTDKSQLKIFPLCWSWPSELYINTVHNKPGHGNVYALCVPRCLKEDSKNLCLEIALSHFQWFQEDRNEFLESTVTSDRTPMQHMKQNKLEWSGDNAPGMHFVILVQYAVINELGRMAFSQKCDHRHNLPDSSECFQKWIATTPTSNDPCLFLNHDQPAVNNRNIHVQVLQSMFVFLCSHSLKTKSHKLEVSLYKSSQACVCVYVHKCTSIYKVD